MLLINSNQGTISFSIALLMNGSMCVIEFLFRDLILRKQKNTLA